MADQICICSVMTSGKIYFHSVTLLGTNELKLLKIVVLINIVWLGKDFSVMFHT
jgi:hypothetical protein